MIYSFNPGVSEDYWFAISRSPLFMPSSSPGYRHESIDELLRRVHRYVTDTANRLATHEQVLYHWGPKNPDRWQYLLAIPSVNKEDMLEIVYLFKGNVEFTPQQYEQAYLRYQLQPWRRLE